MRNSSATGTRVGVAAVVVAVLGFAVFVMMLPRLGESQPEAPVAAGADPPSQPADDSGNGADVDVGGPPRSTTVPATPTSTIATTTTTIPRGADSPFYFPAPPGEDAELTLVLTMDAGEGEDADVIVEGDSITWTLRVTNSGTEYLWGVFGYLELHGPMRCDSTRLAPGETSECTATTIAEAGTHTAWLWATAWTSTSIIGTDLVHPFVVAE